MYAAVAQHRNVASQEVIDRVLQVRIDMPRRPYEVHGLRGEAAVPGEAELLEVVEDGEDERDARGCGDEDEVFVVFPGWGAAVGSVDVCDEWRGRFTGVRAWAREPFGVVVCETFRETGVSADHEKHFTGLFGLAEWEQSRPAVLLDIFPRWERGRRHGGTVGGRERVDFEGT